MLAARAGTVMQVERHFEEVSATLFPGGRGRLLRVEGDDKPRLVGYASMFNNWYDVGGFRERISAGAFAEVLDQDTVASFNHNSDYLLGRNGANLALAEDDNGLRYVVDPMPDTQISRDVRENVRSGILTGSSFAFGVAEDGDVWEQRDGIPHRTITRMSILKDVGPVTFPANKATVVAARSLDMARAKGAPLSVYLERQRLVERI